MKKSIIIIFLITSFLFMACSRTENNGALGGNWQMTEWKNLSNDSLIGTNNTIQLYYTVHRDLLKFQNFTKDGEYYLATFHRTSDSLIINQIYHSPIDTLVHLSELSFLGIDSTGRFRIENLTNENMILKNSIYKITFRKY